MPYSSVEGKEWTKQAIDLLVGDEFTALDIGPGAGTYRDLFPKARMDAIEIWEPYIRRFALDNRYQRVWLGDAKVLLPTLGEMWDVVILGDVIEHLTPEDGKRLLQLAYLHSNKAVILSLPIIHYPQGAEEGNPYETHLAHYSPETVRSDLLANFHIIGYNEGSVVGAYIIRGWTDNLAVYYAEQDKNRKE